MALNAFGRVTAFGVIRGITTDGVAYGETWADNDTIWYNPVTGNPTKTKPVAPNIKVSVGTVIKAGGGGSGSFFAEISHGSVLGGTDSNVQITSPADLQLLQYYASGGYWRNVTLPTNGVTVTSQTATAGQTAFTVSYTPNLLWVYRNGALLDTSDYTATNGTSVTLNVSCAAGDTVTFAAFGPFTLISATGTGNAVLQTSPTINTPILTSPIITGSLPQISLYNSGSGTYTTPANARYLIVEMLGGGGGGSGGGTGSFTAGGSGGNSTFGSILTCTGGGGGPAPWSAGINGAGYTISGGTAIFAAVGGGGAGGSFTATGNGNYTVPGGNGGNSFAGGGGAGGSYVAGGQSAAANSGSGGGGGGGGSAASLVYSGCGGAASGYLKIMITSPSATYSYAVGAGGSAGAAGTGANAATGGAGGSGYISVTAYF